MALTLRIFSVKKLSKNAVKVPMLLYIPAQVEARAVGEDTMVPAEEIAVWIDPLDATQVDFLSLLSSFHFSIFSLTCSIF